VTSSPGILPRQSGLPWLALGLFGATSVTFALAIFLGVADIPPADVIATLLGKGSAQAQSIILDIRLPRIMTGILAGIHFAVAGLLLQNSIRNPLADPSILGVSQGATLAVTVFLLLTVYIHNPGPNAQVDLPLAWLPLVGLTGGMIAGAIIYLLALHRDLGPLRLTLCGVAVGALLHALAIGLIAGWGSARLEILLEWLAALIALHRPIDLLRFEAASARSFGLSYRTYFSLVLGLACGLAASAVGAVGPLVFVGLVVPHLARFLAGRNVALVLPLTAALGAILVTLGDLAGRLVGGAEEIPIGVVMAVCGVPVLVVLLRRMP
jgi:iron complex transport system permease protein